MPNYRLIPNASQDELFANQLSGLRWTVNHVLKGSDFYRKRLNEAGVSSAQDIVSLDDLRRLPVTTTSDLRDGYPYPLLSVPLKDVVRLHASSGTTGKRKVMSYTQNDVNTFSLQMARCFELAGLTPEDRVQIAVGYGLWTAGIGFQLGCEKLGCMSIPIGPGNIEMHLQFLVDAGSTCLGSTASMALLLSEEVERNNLFDKISLKKIIFGAEPHDEKMRRNFERKLGLEDSFDIAGMTEMFGPGSALDCPHHTGLHYWADLFIIEVLDPETLEPVPEGEVGEMVVTTLTKEASPLLRYRTGDLSRLIPGVCSCGLQMPRHDKIMGRSDDMIIFRGVNIYPGQISDVLKAFPEAAGEYNIQLWRDDDGRDSMLLKVERSNMADSGNDAALARAILRTMQQRVMVSPQVEIVDPGVLPRFMGKARRVEDKRF
ncbi:MAG: phenylacetate--CoA ligase [Desulfovibrionaceae bacterium]|nr:phenylacetate--CoA ligase [Desulfovibrionaceae bacterium]